MGLNEVSAVLWQERNLLETLAFKLEAQQLLVVAGRDRWLARATREVEELTDQLRETELIRAMEVDAAAPGLGLAPGASLRELADAAPAPWGSMFDDHRAAFAALAFEIDGLAAANRALLAQGARSVQDALDRATDPSTRPTSHTRRPMRRHPSSPKRTTGQGGHPSGLLGK